MTTTVPFISILFLIVLSSFISNANENKEDTYEPSDPEPSPEETLILEYINRFRADPATEALLIAPLDDPAASIGLDQVDLEIFRSETSKLEPSPPLVFDLALIRAARLHSHYQILNGQCYYQDPDKPGFSGYASTARTKSAGYRASECDISESSYDQAINPWHAYTVDTLCYSLECDQTGMTPDRNARVINHNPRFKEVGCGYLPGKNLFTISKVFAEGDGKRFSGGVAYIDSNRNGFYDIGEGCGDVIISSGGTTVTSWKSGAYALSIEKSNVTISAQMDDWMVSESFVSGQDNVKFDILVPKKEDLKKALRLIAANNKSKRSENDAVSFKALLELYDETRDLILDKETRSKIDSITLPAISKLKSANKDILDAFTAGDMREARKIIFNRKKVFSRTFAFSWFADAERCSRQKEKYDQMAEFSRKGKKLSEKRLLQIVDGMQKEVRKLKTDEWKEWLTLPLSHKYFAARSW